MEGIEFYKKFSFKANTIIKFLFSDNKQEKEIHHKKMNTPRRKNKESAFYFVGNNVTLPTYL